MRLLVTACILIISNCIITYIRLGTEVKVWIDKYGFKQSQESVNEHWIITMPLHSLIKKQQYKGDNGPNF